MLWRTSFYKDLSKSFIYVSSRFLLRYCFATLYCQWKIYITIEDFFFFNFFFPVNQSFAGFLSFDLSNIGQMLIKISKRCVGCMVLFSKSKQVNDYCLILRFSCIRYQLSYNNICT